MKVDLDGAARNIKSCLNAKEDTHGAAFMVDEFVRHIRELEKQVHEQSIEIDTLSKELDRAEQMCNSYKRAAGM